MKRNSISIILSILICAIVLMLTTYIHVAIVTDLEQNYYMTSNHKVFRKGNKHVSFFDVIDLEVDSNVVVISEYDEKDYVGIYDPMMVLAGENTYQLAGRTRYFNQSDYKNKFKSGILLSNIEHQNQCQTLGKSKMDVVLYCAENIDMYKEKTTHLLNLSALDDLGDTVYIDFDDPKTAESFLKKIESFGYQDISVKNYRFIDVFSKLEVAQIILYMSVLLAVYLLLYMMLFWSFLNDRKYIYLHFLHGGNQKTIFLRYLQPFLLGNTIGLIFIYFIKEMLVLIHFVKYSNVSFMMLVLAHVLISMILLFISFSIIYKKVTKSYEELNYVH